MFAVWSRIGRARQSPGVARNPAGEPSVHSAPMPVRHQCSACGNRTRFDVVVTRRAAAYFHYTIGGERTVEDETVLEESIESVRCGWCGADDDRVVTLTDDDVEALAPPGTASV